MICPTVPGGGDRVSSGKTTLYALVGNSVDVYALIGISVRSELRRSGSIRSKKVRSAENMCNFSLLCIAEPFVENSVAYTSFKIS